MSEAADSEMTKKDKTGNIQVGEIRSLIEVLRSNRLASGSLVYLLILNFVAILAPLIAPYDPFSQNLTQRLGAPSLSHLLGLDEFGRDELSRLIFGARISIQVGVEVVTLSLLLGVVVGVMAGFYGGWIDTVLMRLADVFLAFPSLVLAIGITAVTGPGIFNVVLALIAVSWPTYARVIRGETLTIRNADFIVASRISGASNYRIITSSVIPNTLPPVIVLSALGMGGAILAEAGLSFLGLGINPPDPSWGIMISSGQTFLLQAPHLVVVPGLAVAFTVLSFNLIGDGLRDALDPKLRI
jgi:peptide/nickel transport system permease protein